MFRKFLEAIGLAAARGALTGHKEPAVMLDAQGWFHGPRVVRYPSVREYALNSEHNAAPQPVGIVWHFTATKVGTAKSLAKRIQKYKRGKDRAASWHILIATDGTIYQSVSIERGAWHCGTGRWRGHRINRGCVGIELEGYGLFFTPEQIESAKLVTEAIADAYELDLQDCALDHSQFDPKRRSDAGLVWSAHRAAFLSEIF